MSSDFSLENILQEVNQEQAAAAMPTLDSLSLPVLDATANTIIMHRDVHFGGKFSIMLDYYNNEGKGVQYDFSTAHIEALDTIEKEKGINLSALILSASDIEEIENAKEIYKNLRAIYEVESPQTRHPRLIADLILSEDIDAVEEVAAIVTEGKALVPSLIDLLSKDQFVNPLLPGYGHAPALAAKCLGELKSEKAIPSLFEATKTGDEDLEIEAIAAMRKIGAPAIEFLLSVMNGQPITQDNTHATTMAILCFHDNESIALNCFEKLMASSPKDDHIWLSTLILGLAALPEEKRPLFHAWKAKQDLPSMLEEHIQAVFLDWEEAGS